MTTRVGKRWTQIEEQELMTGLKEGKSYEEISTSLSRSVGGIKIRAIDVALNTLSETMTTQEISDLIKIPYEDVIKRVNLNSIKSLSASSKPSTKQTKIKGIDSTPENSISEDESIKIHPTFDMLWKFKIFLKTKIQFDNEMHDYFDEFVKNFSG